MTSPYDVLTRITSRRSAPEPAGERCEMCSEPIADEHQHVVNVAARQLMCVCRACYLLFTDSQAQLRYRAVPDRYLAFPDFALDRRAWEALQIPVGVAFFFTNSALGRTVAFYPGPAGATESELDLEAWNAIMARTLGSTCSPTTSRRCWFGFPKMATPAKRPSRKPIWCRSTPATSSSDACGCCGAGSTAAKRRGSSSTASSRRSSSLPGNARGDAAMSEEPLNIAFTVLDVAPEPYTVSPVLTARVSVAVSTDDPVHAIALRCQVRIEPLRRAYSDDEAAGLTDLFGPRERWATTQRTFLWQHCTAMVPASPATRRSRFRWTAPTTSRSPPPSTCTRCATAHSHCNSCSVEPFSSSPSVASRSSRCRGTARIATTCRSRCGGI